MTRTMTTVHVVSYLVTVGLVVLGTANLHIMHMIVLPA